MAEYLRPSDVARIFGVPVSTVRGWIRHGLLEARKDRATGRLYVTRAAVEARKADLAKREPGRVPENFVRRPPRTDSTPPRREDPPPEAAAVEPREGPKMPPEKKAAKKPAKDADEPADASKESDGARKAPANDWDREWSR